MNVSDLEFCPNG